MPVSLKSTHPSYSPASVFWTIMRDTYAGQEAIKAKGTEYLPATPSMVADGMGVAQQEGQKRYDAYRIRAVFHDIVGPAVEAMIGLMHKQPPEITLPAKLSSMLKNATLQGESLEMLLRRINENQLLLGNLGLMLDVQDGAGPSTIPHFVTYCSETVTNWDVDKVDGREQLSFVVLNETRQERTPDLSWQSVEQYRVLAMSELAAGAWPEAGALPAQTYMRAAAHGSSTLLGSEFVAPSIGGETLKSVPFRFIGARDLVPLPDRPPTIGLARLAIAIYQTEADFRQSLHLQAQDTLVVVGGNKPAGDEAVKVGAGHIIDVQVGGDAKYVSVGAAGLEHMAGAINSDKAQASNLGANMLVQKGADAESGDSLRIRVAAKTASLGSIAKTGAEGLQQLLQQAAIWVGASPDQVSVVPNTEFADADVTGQDLVQWMTAKQMGAPLSNRSIHQILALANKTTMTFEEEQDVIEEEGPIGPVPDPNAIDPAAATRGIPGAKKPLIPRK